MKPVKQGWICQQCEYPALRGNLIPTILTLPDSKHLSATYGTDTLSCWPTILHGYDPGVLHFPFGTTFHTVCLHWTTSPFLIMNDKLFFP